MKKLRVLSVARATTVLAAAWILSGCGGALYAVQASSAVSKLEEARQLGAKKQAPYEYFYAREHMNKASEEAAQGDYGDAIDLAEIAEEAADKAIRLTREAKRGAGR